MRTPLRRPISQVLEGHPALVADHDESVSGLTLTASRADLLKTLAQSRPRSYGAGYTFFTIPYAQFWRDWTAMVGYRSADQIGGTARLVPSSLGARSVTSGTSAMGTQCSLS